MDVSAPGRAWSSGWASGRRVQNDDGDQSPDVFEGRSARLHWVRPLDGRSRPSGTTSELSPRWTSSRVHR